MWDGIVSIAAHASPELRKHIRGQVVDSLKKNGAFILEAYMARHIEMDGIGGPPPSRTEMFMSLKELESELHGLDVVVGAEVERNTSEGKYHQGASAVVQIVARKVD